jgi:F-type H+-transporting ATPase subunit a
LFAAFTAILATSGFLSFLGVLPLVMNVAFYGFELFVACLQAYIFTVLTCVYIQSAIDLH